MTSRRKSILRHPEPLTKSSDTVAKTSKSWPGTREEDKFGNHEQLCNVNSLYLSSASMQLFIPRRKRR
jgi:hypothetical protein